MSLRDVDWKWLLPVKSIERALCLARGGLARSLRVERSQTALAAQIDFELTEATAGSYDLVIVSTLDRPTLHAAHRALRADGVLYLEWHSWRLCTIEALTKSLQSAGFEFSHAVLRWPSQRRTEAWLPIGRRPWSARFYCFEYALHARHPLKRLLSRVMRINAFLRTRLALSRDFSVVCRLFTGQPAPQESGAPWWVAESAAARSRSDDWLLLTPGGPSDTETRVIGLTGGGQAQGPSTVSLFGRTPGSSARLAIAEKALKAVVRSGVQPVLHTPVVIGHLADGDSLALLETYVRGQPLDEMIRSGTLAKSLTDTAGWLTTLAIASRRERSGHAWRESIEPTINRFCACCADWVDHAMLSDALNLLVSVRSMPAVMEHHDFRPWNILVAGNSELSAVDWDGARTNGTPAVDLIQCHAYLHFALDGTMRSHRYLESFVSHRSGPHSTIQRRCYTNYAEQLALGEDALRILSGFAWMELATEQLEALQKTRHGLDPSQISCTLLPIWELEAKRSLC